MQAFTRRFLATRASFQSAILITLNTLALADVISLREDVILAIDACIGGWLLWANNVADKEGLDNLAELGY